MGVGDQIRVELPTILDHHELTQNPVFQPAMRVKKSICALEKVLSFRDQARPGGQKGFGWLVYSMWAALWAAQRPFKKSSIRFSALYLNDRHRLKDGARIVVLGDEVHVQIF